MQGAVSSDSIGYRARPINPGPTHDEGRHEALPTSQHGGVVGLHSYEPEFFIPDQHGGARTPS